MCLGGKKKKEAVKEEVEVEQEEQEVEVKEAAKTEAVKVQEVKEADMEAKAETFTAPVSTLDKEAIERKRQKELAQNISDKKAKDMDDQNMASLISGKFREGAEKSPIGSAVFGSSKKRAGGKGRKSLITSKSGGGIGYFNRFI